MDDIEVDGFTTHTFETLVFLYSCSRVVFDFHFITYWTQIKAEPTFHRLLMLVLLTKSKVHTMSHKKTNKYNQLHTQCIATIYMDEVCFPY